MQVYIAGGSGMHIVSAIGTDSGALPNSSPITLNPGEEIYFETSVPSSWNWYGVSDTGSS